MDCPVNNIIARLLGTAGIPTATHMTTFNFKNKNNINNTSTNPPNPFLRSKLILSLSN